MSTYLLTAFTVTQRFLAAFLLALPLLPTILAVFFFFFKWNHFYAMNLNYAMANKIKSQQVLFDV